MRTALKYIQILTTVTEKGDAERIAKILLDKKLSACTQIIGPITSVYRWEGEVRESGEWLCIIKTKKNHYRKVEAAIKKIHPYKLPEIIAVPIIAGSSAYLKWLAKEIEK